MQVRLETTHMCKQGFSFKDTGKHKAAMEATDRINYTSNCLSLSLVYL